MCSALWSAARRSARWPPTTPRPRQRCALTTAATPEAKLLAALSGRRCAWMGGGKHEADFAIFHALTVIVAPLFYGCLNAYLAPRGVPRPSTHTRPLTHPTSHARSHLGACVPGWGRGRGYCTHTARRRPLGYCVLRWGSFPHACMLCRFPSLHMRPRTRLIGDRSRPDRSVGGTYALHAQQQSVARVELPATKTL
jgi:hypothetical protein